MDFLAHNRELRVCLQSRCLRICSSKYQVGIDFLLRIVIIEPHKVAKWKESAETAASLENSDSSPRPPSRKPTSMKAFLGLFLNSRALVSAAISFAFGIYVGGALDGALTLRLNQRYGLDSLGAGLVFIANAVSSAAASPIAGILVDKYGPKWIALAGMTLTCPAIALLCIDSMPLAGFIVVLALVGESLSNFRHSSSTAPDVSFYRYYSLLSSARYYRRSCDDRS